MARSAAQCSEDRVDRREGTAREHLGEGRTKEALNEAINGLKGELPKIRERRGGDGALMDAELAGMILAITEYARTWRPARPAGCPRFGMPPAQILLDVFTAARQRPAPVGENR